MCWVWKYISLNSSNRITAINGLFFVLIHQDVPNKLHWGSTDDTFRLSSLYYPVSHSSLWLVTMRKLTAKSKLQDTGGFLHITLALCVFFLHYFAAERRGLALTFPHLYPDKVYSIWLFLTWFYLLMSLHTVRQGIKSKVQHTEKQ